MEKKMMPDSFCKISRQHDGCQIYFKKSLAEKILQTMPFSKQLTEEDPEAPAYFVEVESEKITITVARL